MKKKLVLCILILSTACSAKDSHLQKLEANNSILTGVEIACNEAEQSYEIKVTSYRDAWKADAKYPPKDDSIIVNGKTLAHKKLDHTCNWKDSGITIKTNINYSQKTEYKEITKLKYKMVALPVDTKVFKGGKLIAQSNAPQAKEIENYSFKSENPDSIKYCLVFNEKNFCKEFSIQNLLNSPLDIRGEISRVY